MAASNQQDTIAGGEFRIAASAGGKRVEHSASEKLAACRRRAAIYCGDFELEVFVLPRNRDPDLSRILAERLQDRPNFANKFRKRHPSFGRGVSPGEGDGHADGQDGTATEDTARSPPCEEGGEATHECMTLEATDAEESQILDAPTTLQGTQTTNELLRKTSSGQLVSECGTAGDCAAGKHTGQLLAEEREEAAGVPDYGGRTIMYMRELMLRWSVFGGRWTLREPAMKDEVAEHWRGKRPADALWAAVNFGELYWSWQECSPGLSGTNYQGVYGLDADTGTRFLPRIWAGLEPEATAEDVLNAKAAALEEFAAMPDVLKDGIPKEEMAGIIGGSCDMLAEVARENGTFAEAALGKDALSTIEEISFIHEDGNDRRFIFTTATHCYAISCQTS